MTSYLEIFDEAIANCEVLLSSLKQTKDPDLNPFDSSLNEFHENIASLAKVLSHEATKFAIAHSSPPLPDLSATRSLAGGLCNAASQLVGCYLLLPTSVGATFLNAICKELEALITNLRQFVGTIQNIVTKNEKLESCLQTTGIIWEFCDKVPTLPKNNSEAVTRVLNMEGKLIADAIEELEQARIVYDNEESSDDSDDESAIRGAAIPLLPSVRALIKSTAALIRKTKKLVTCFNSSEQTKLDPLVAKISTLSTSVDDLICSLYTPVNVTHVVEYGSVLSSNLRQLLETLSQGIAGEEDQNWIELLTTGIQHNLTNLQSKALGGVA